MRLREPAAWVALGALVLNLLLAVVALATFDGSFASVAWVLSARLANPVPLLVLTVLVSFCVLRDRTPHARQLTLISLVVGVIAVLLGLIFALFGFGATAPVLAVFAAIVQQAISVIAIGFLIKLVQLQAVPRRLPAGIGLGTVSLGRASATAGKGRQISGCNQPGTPTPQPAQPGVRRAMPQPGPLQLAGGLTVAVGWQPIPTPTERARSERAAAVWAAIWRAATQWAAIQCVQTLRAPARSAGTAGSDTKRRQDASANAGHRNRRRAMPKDPWADQGQRDSQQHRASTGGAVRSRNRSALPVTLPNIRKPLDFYVLTGM